MARKRSKKAAAAEAGDAKPAQASGSAQAGAHGRAHRPPPQGRGLPQRPNIMGAQPGYERLNIAMQVRRDPVARTSFSRVYSGQARDWRR
jgi:hypothetical protein